METKKKKPGKVMKWLDDHTVEILMGFLLVGGGVAGFIAGKDLGYVVGLEEFRKEHIDIAKNLIDGCGSQGAFTALDYVRDNKDAYNTLMKNPNEVIAKVEKMYYSTEYVKGLVDFYNK